MKVVLRICEDVVPQRNSAYYLRYSISMLDDYQSQGEAVVHKLEDRMERLSPVFRSYVLPWDVKRLVYIMVVRSCMEYAVFIPNLSDKFWLGG